MTSQSAPVTYTLDVTNDSETAVHITASLVEDGNIPLGYTYRIGTDETVSPEKMEQIPGESGYFFTQSLK